MPAATLVQATARTSPKPSPGGQTHATASQTAQRGPHAHTTKLPQQILPRLIRESDEARCPCITPPPLHRRREGRPAVRPGHSTIENNSLQTRHASGKDGQIKAIARDSTGCQPAKAHSMQSSACATAHGRINEFLFSSKGWCEAGTLASASVQSPPAQDVYSRHMPQLHFNTSRLPFTNTTYTNNSASTTAQRHSALSRAGPDTCASSAAHEYKNTHPSRGRCALWCAEKMG